MKTLASLLQGRARAKLSIGTLETHNKIQWPQQTKQLDIIRNPPGTNGCHGSTHSGVLDK